MKSFRILVPELMHEVKRRFIALPSLLLLLTLNSGLVAQNELENKPNLPRFNKLLNENKNERPISITETIDKGFLMLSNYEVSKKPESYLGRAFNIKFSKYNKDGIFEWSQIYDNDRIGWGQEIIAVKKGGYLFAGNTVTSNLTEVSGYKTNDIDAQVDKFNEQGKLVWHINLGKPKVDGVKEMIPSNRNTFLVLHTTSFDGSNGIEILLSKINNDGDLLWSKKVAGARKIKYPRIASDKNGLCYLSYAFNDKCYLILIDKDGNTIWKKEFSTPRDNTRYVINSMIKSNNYIVVAGYTMPYKNSKADFWDFQDFWICKIDSNGQNIWDKVFGGNHQDHIHALSINDEQEIILAGTTKSSESREFKRKNFGFSDIWMLKLDKFGSTIWERHFGGDGFEFVSKLLPTTQNTFLLLGSSDSRNPNFTDREYDGEKYTYIIEIDESGKTVINPD